MLSGNSTAWNPGSSSTSPLHFRSDSVPSGGSAGYRGLLPGLSTLPANTWRSRRSFTLMTRAIFVASTEGQSPPLPHGPALALSQFLSSTIVGPNPLLSHGPALALDPLVVIFLTLVAVFDFNVDNRAESSSPSWDCSRPM
jgi:hypothetical protein